MSKTIKVLKNGPYNVTGGVPMNQLEYVPNSKGYSLDYKEIGQYPSEESYYLCRCGESAEKPYCDGSHTKGFDGTETAKPKTYDEMATYIEGIRIDMMDAERLCAGARFCDTKSSAWNLVQKAENPDVEEIVKQQTLSCPSGRLTAVTKDGKRIETAHKEEISILEDPAAKTIGPIWVKGGIAVESAEGVVYPSRDKITLCRCGKSRNKPFCDTSHFKK